MDSKNLYMFVFRIIEFCGTRRGVRNIFIMINMDIVVPRKLGRCT